MIGFIKKKAAIVTAWITTCLFILGINIKISEIFKKSYYPFTTVLELPVVFTL